MGRRSRRRLREGVEPCRTQPKTRNRESNRVVLQRPPGIDEWGGREDTFVGSLEHFAEDWRTSQGIRPVVALRDGEVAWGTKPAADDEVGYCMDTKRGDDCFQAAIATVIEEVSDETERAARSRTVTQITASTT